MNLISVPLILFFIFNYKFNELVSAAKADFQNLSNNSIQDINSKQMQKKDDKIEDLQKFKSKIKKLKNENLSFHKNSQLRLVYKKLIPHGQLRPQANIIFEYSDIEDDRKRTCRCICQTKHN